eukprot:2893237-Amphidinium_carterae.1
MQIPPAEGILIFGCHGGNWRCGHPVLYMLGSPERKLCNVPRWTTLCKNIVWDSDMFGYEPGVAYWNAAHPCICTPTKTPT